MKRNDAVRKEIARYVAANPSETYRTIAAKVGCAWTTISKIAREFGVGRGRKPISAEQLKGLKDAN